MNSEMLILFNVVFVKIYDQQWYEMVFGNDNKTVEEWYKYVGHNKYVVLHSMGTVYYLVCYWNVTYSVLWRLQPQKGQMPPTSPFLLSL